jgi:quinol monooxygenase YgiN
MVNRGLLVRLEAKPGKDAEVEEFLRSAVPLVQQEAATTAWFAIRFGRSEYGIFDVFPDDAGREVHLNGPIAKALMEKADALFAVPPRIQKLDILANKLPETTPTEPVTKGLLLTFQAKSGHGQDVEQFLRDARPMVQDEPKTTAWFALRLEDGTYGIFDVFPDNGGRFAHLTGQVPRELGKHALTLLGSVPDMEMLNLLAEKLAGLVATKQPEAVGAVR